MVAREQCFNRGFAGGIADQRGHYLVGTTCSTQRTVGANHARTSFGAPSALTQLLSVTFAQWSLKWDQAFKGAETS